MQGRIIGSRVFLEGIEIDVASVGVQGLLGQSATATIEIPAADAVHRFLPRTLVHVFYHENDHRLVDPADRGSAVVADSGNPNIKENWRLLFAGEVVKYRYTNAGGSRQAVLVCQDFSSYWGAARLYWGSNNTSLHSYKQAIAAGASQVYAGKKQIRNTNALVNLLLAKPATNPKLTGILGGVISLMEAATGVFHPDAKRKFRGVNDFMSQAELRLHLTHMLGASPDDRTSAKYLSSYRFKRYVRRLARSLGSTASFAELLDLVLGRIHYRWMSVPAPPYFPKNQDSVVKSKVVENRKAQAIVDPDIRADVKLIRDLYNLTQARNKAALKRYGNAKGDPPQTVDNKADPHQLKIHTGGSNPTSEPDTGGHEAYARHGAARLFPPKKYWIDRSSKLKGRLTAQGAKDRFDARIGTGYSWIADAAELLHDHIRKDYPGLRFIEHTTINIQNLRQLLKKGMRALGGGLGGTTGVVNANVAVGDRLNCHLFTPDLFMAPPPTCNVLFPDHYTSIHFSRDWLSETTRLLLHTKTASGRDRKNIYFAPTADILSGPPDTDVLQAVKRGASFLMRHEEFSGPVIAIEGIGDTTIFRSIHKEVKKANAEGKGKGEEVSGEALYSPQEHLRRAANYLFFAKRFSTRTMVVQARFSPQVVVGLPCMVLDPLLSGRELKNGEVPKGTHFIGTVAALIHHTDARGTSTSTIHLVKCREHREADKLYSEEQQDKEQARAPGSRRIVGWQVFSSILKRDEQFHRADGSWRADRDRPVYVGKRKIKIRKTDTIAPTGRSYDVAGPNAPVPYIGTINRPVHVEVVVTRSVGRSSIPRKVSFNFEQSATPPWFAECFLPHNIGEQFYRPMLGCGSVLDDNPLLTRLDVEAEAAKEAAKKRAIASHAAIAALAEAGGEEAPPRDDPAIPENTVTLKIRNGDGTTRESEIPGLLLLPAMSTSQAADQLAGSWKLLTENGADMSLFVDSYVSRSYATLTDIMGDLNLDLRFRQGHELRSRLGSSEVPGFHGNAYGNLTNLMSYPDFFTGDQEPLQFEPLATPTSGSAAKGLRTVPGTVDPRAERRSRIVDYVNELRDHH